MKMRGSGVTLTVNGLETVWNSVEITENPPEEDNLPVFSALTNANVTLSGFVKNPNRATRRWNKFQKNKNKKRWS